MNVRDLMYDGPRPTRPCSSGTRESRPGGEDTLNQRVVVKPGGKIVVVQKLRDSFPQHPRTTSEPGRRHFIRGRDDETEHEVAKQPDGDFKNLHTKHRLTWPLFLQRSHTTPLFPPVRSDSSEHAQRIAIRIHVNVVAVLIVRRVQTFARHLRPCERPPGVSSRGDTFRARLDLEERCR